MAIAISLEFAFVDDKGETSSTTVRVPNGFTLAQYGEFGFAMAQLFADASGCAITGVSINFALDLSGLGLKTVANALSDVAEKAQFIWNTVTGSIKKIFRIPTFSESLVQAGTDAVDTADLAVAAFVTANTNGIVVTGGTVAPTNSRDNDVVSLASARQQFRRTLV
jgi:hypothetical protein